MYTDPGTKRWYPVYVDLLFVDLKGHASITTWPEEQHRVDPNCTIHDLTPLPEREYVSGDQFRGGPFTPEEIEQMSYPVYAKPEDTQPVGTRACFHINIPMGRLLDNIHGVDGLNDLCDRLFDGPMLTDINYTSVDVIPERSPHWCNGRLVIEVDAEISES
jgi:hypothetical protein